MLTQFLLSTAIVYGIPGTIIATYSYLIHPVRG